MIERERTYLVKALPVDLLNHPSTLIRDVYIIGKDGMGQLRARSKGSHYELTKKYPVQEGDISRQQEDTILINQEEFEYLFDQLPCEIEKRRYHYILDDIIYDIDVFEGKLAGLIMADVEFSTDELLESFVPPAFLGEEVTQNVAYAGGILCQR